MTTHAKTETFHTVKLSVIMQKDKKGRYRWFLVDPDDPYEIIFASKSLEPEHLPSKLFSRRIEEFEAPEHITEAWPKSLQSPEKRVILRD